MEKIEIRRMEIKDFEKVHELVNQIYKLHLNKREDIYRNEDPLYKKDFPPALTVLPHFSPLPLHLDGYQG